jgi:hypothetical protein
MPFHASFLRDENGTTGICKRDLNFWIRVVWAASSDSVVVGEGVGGRIRFNDVAGSLTRPSTLGLMPLGLGVGRITGYVRFVRDGCVVSARCSIDDGDL